MSSTTFRAAYAKHVLNKNLLQKYNAFCGKNETKLPSPESQNILDVVERPPDLESAVCVVGAGAAGLSTAILLTYLGFKNVWVLEATDRVGGRVYTHQFTSGDECRHNYYDVGAMRIPNIATQQSTLNMIEFLNSNGESVPLKEYTYDDPMAPSWHEFSSENIDFDGYMKKLLTKWEFPLFDNPSSKTFDQAFQDFLVSSQHPDQWSTRGWLMQGPAADAPQPPWSYLDTQRVESFNTSTGLFDQAFMETICDWFDFDDAQNAHWYRVDGGMSVLTDALSNYATKNGANILKRCPVTAMSDNGQTITVKYASENAGELQPKPPTEYAAVFNTTTFGCLQHIDIQGLKLPADNMCAIRTLSYDRATKVAIKFKTGWWRGLIPNGGVSNTNLCISNVVYPSWNDSEDDGTESPYTIIVSYSWAQDATRIASLSNVNDHESTDPTDPIVQLCLRDLVTLWSTTKDHKQTLEGLQSQYIAHHVYSWSRNPYTAGAYALFGPGQFQYLYPLFTTPLCGNKLSICGEAVSAHHAWISGAFDSSYNAVYAWCTANGYLSKAEELRNSPFACGKGHNTAELDQKLLLWDVELAKLEQKRDSRSDQK